MAWPTLKLGSVALEGAHLGFAANRPRRLQLWNGSRPMLQMICRARVDTQLCDIGFPMAIAQL